MTDVLQNENLQLNPNSELELIIVPSTALDTPATDDFCTESSSSLLHAARQKVSTSDHQNDQININGTLMKTCAVDTEASRTLTFAELSAAELSLPFRWVLEKQSYQNQNSIVMFTIKMVKVNEMNVPFILKSLVVKDDMLVDLSVLGRALDLKKFNMPGRIDDIEQLQDLLVSINRLNVCSGCTGSSFETAINQLNCSTIKRDITGQWRHDMCNLLLRNAKICKFCQTAKKTLGTKLRRWKESQGKKHCTQIPAMSPTQKVCWLDLQSKYRSAVRDKIQARKKIKILKSKLVASRMNTSCLTDFNFDDLLEEGSISQN